MEKGNPSNLLRIGVFYDGQYFFNVSNYYCYQHSRRSRLSISGLHEFIRDQIAEKCNKDIRLCQIVDAHYFRGRLAAKLAEGQNKLLQERIFDDILMSENITTHYMPLRSNYAGGYQEKGIDVWLALEAYELAIYKRFDVLVLIACDGDYLPLVRKLNTLGTQVMLLSWDFEYTDGTGAERKTRTSQGLLEEVSYPMSMHTIIDDRVKQKEAIVQGLFLPSGNSSASTNKEFPSDKSSSEDQKVLNEEALTETLIESKAAATEYTSTILRLCDGFGFIKTDSGNLFFHYTSLENCDFNSLVTGMNVRYTVGKNKEGKDVAEKVWVLQ